MDPVWLIGIPLLSLIQFVMTLGASMAVSTINVYFMDFQFIVAFLLNLFFWMTPIIYELQAVPEAYRSLFMYLNPMTSLISLWRVLFMSNTLDLEWDMFLSGSKSHFPFFTLQSPEQPPSDALEGGLPVLLTARGTLQRSPATKSVRSFSLRTLRFQVSIDGMM